MSSTSAGLFDVGQQQQQQLCPVLFRLLVARKSLLMVLRYHLDEGGVTYRNPIFSYAKAAWVLAYNDAPRLPEVPTGLLGPMRIAPAIRGYFKPLTMIPETAVPGGSTEVMVGCQIALQGPGVQWALDKVSARHVKIC